VCPTLTAFAVSLALTLALEVPVAAAFGARNRRDLLLAVLVNVLTNPPVVLACFAIAPATGWPSLAVQLPLEALAVAAEALCYAKCARSIRHPIALSICANGWSYTVGLALCAII
jgi:hypothetical protein